MFFRVCRSNIRQNDSVRARHPVRLMEEWNVRALTLHSLGSTQLNGYHPPEQRGRHRAHLGEDDNRHQDKARQENRSRNNLHSARARLIAGAMDDDDYLAQHSRAVLAQLRIGFEQKGISLFAPSHSLLHFFREQIKKNSALKAKHLHLAVCSRYICALFLSPLQCLPIIYIRHTANG